jgi:hypothetical protein
VNKDSRSHRWTEDEVRQLASLAAHGESEESIARALGRTVLAVRTKAAHHRLTLRRDATTDPDRQALPWERRERSAPKRGEA